MSVALPTVLSPTPHPSTLRSPRELAPGSETVVKDARSDQLARFEDDVVRLLSRLAPTIGAIAIAGRAIGQIQASRSCDDIAGVSAQERRNAMNLLRERCTPRPDIVEHNGLITDPLTRRVKTVDVWLDGEWLAYGSPEVQLESGGRAPAWYEPVNRVKEIAMGSGNRTRPVSGKAMEMLCVRLPGDPDSGNFTVGIEASKPSMVKGPTFVRQGDTYHAVVVATEDYEGMAFRITPNANARTASV